MRPTPETSRHVQTNPTRTPGRVKKGHSRPARLVADDPAGLFERVSWSSAQRPSPRCLSTPRSGRRPALPRGPGSRESTEAGGLAPRETPNLELHNPSPERRHPSGFARSRRGCRATARRPRRPTQEPEFHVPSPRASSPARRLPTARTIASSPRCATLTRTDVGYHALYVMTNPQLGTRHVRQRTDTSETSDRERRSHHDRVPSRTPVRQGRRIDQDRLKGASNA